MIEHVVLAVLIQCPLVLLLRSWAAGTAAACAWSLSRELTQAEYRWIEQFGGGLRANMPWWGGMDPRVWQRLDPWLDWLIPSLAVVAIAFMVKLKASRKS